MRISDWSSDVCSSDLGGIGAAGGIEDHHAVGAELALHQGFDLRIVRRLDGDIVVEVGDGGRRVAQHEALAVERQALCQRAQVDRERSEEHTSELQSLMRISYAVFCLKKKKNKNNTQSNTKQQIRYLKYNIPPRKTVRTSNKK